MDAFFSNICSQLNGKSQSNNIIYSNDKVIDFVVGSYNTVNMSELLSLFNIPDGYELIYVYPNTESNGAMWYQIQATYWAEKGITLRPSYSINGVSVNFVGIIRKKEQA